MKKVILFDLDGTLLPMDQERFVKAYFYALIKKLAELGVPAQTEEEKKVLAKAIWAGTYSMMNNDGACTNEEKFFLDFSTISNIDIAHLKPQLDGFYQNEFNEVSAVCGRNPLVARVISELKGRGYRVAVATNPLFPLRANESRLRWAGLSLSDFEYCTCYENSRFCKPKLEYYRGILDVLGVLPEDCIMVGNDVREDMVAKELGMDVFLITDYIINVENRDINEFPHGSWVDFEEYINNL